MLRLAKARALGGLRRRRRMRGRGFGQFLSRANNFLKKSGLISSIGTALGNAGIPLAGEIGSAAQAFGYGRRFSRRRRGGALRLAGAARMR